MFGDLSFSHILILMLIVVLVFGAKRIPEIGSSLGQGIKEFRRSMKDVVEDRPEPRGVQPPAASPTSSLPAGGDPKRLNQ
jgi:sec-independent protein translocase protein TatA